MQQNKLAILCMVIIIMSHSQVFAQSQTDRKTTSANAKAGQAKRANNSSENRVEKAGYIALDAIGFSLTPVFGVRGGVFVNSDFLLEANLARGSSGFLVDKAEKTLVEVKAKYFLGNSFYLDAGGAYESWDIDYSTAYIDSSNQFQDVSSTGKIVNSGVSFHLGNQWQWSGFTMGCDWIGYFYALSSSSTFDTPGETGVTYFTFDEKNAKSRYEGSSLHNCIK